MTRRQLDKLLKEDCRRIRRGETPQIMPSIGGYARAASLTTSRRSESASNAAKARWAKSKAQPAYKKGSTLAETAGIPQQSGEKVEAAHVA